jgi:DNA repair exonuclease SbcCD ATPase subunit
VHRTPTLMAAIAILTCAACYDTGNSLYLGALEKIGLEKRDMLVKRVKNAKEAQQEAQEQFRDALEEFQSVVAHDGGELEKRYEQLRREYEASAEKADEVRDRISGIKKVSDKLFREWDRELEEYTDSDMRRISRQQLVQTRERSAELIATMERAASRMDPVLTKLKERVLFLKHNLNAQALGSLAQTSEALEADVSTLIGEMETSIAEADAFIAEMQPS